MLLGSLGEHHRVDRDGRTLGVTTTSQGAGYVGKIFLPKIVQAMNTQLLSGFIAGEDLTDSVALKTLELLPAE